MGGKTTAWVRFKNENAAKDLAEKLNEKYKDDEKLKVKDTEIVFRVLEGDEEKEYLENRTVRKTCWEPWPSSPPAGTGLAWRPSDTSSMTRTTGHSSPEHLSPGSRSPSSTPSTTAAWQPSGMSASSFSS